MRFEFLRYRNAEVYGVCVYHKRLLQSQLTTTCPKVKSAHLLVFLSYHFTLKFLAHNLTCSGSSHYIQKSYKQAQTSSGLHKYWQTTLCMVAQNTVGTQ